MTSGKSGPLESAGQVIPSAQSDDSRTSQFELVIERNHQIVYRYAYRLAGCQSAAEDISQEVFLKAFRAAHQLRETEKERAWLLAITRNEFAKWLRTKRPKQIVEEIANADYADLSPHDYLDNQDWIEVALRELSEEFREVVLMYYFEDLSYAEIAQQLSIPIGTVMSRLNRGRNALRRYLDPMAVSR